MFPVEIGIPDEDALTGRMTMMREWLDHQRFEPATFRYTFTSPGIWFGSSSRWRPRQSHSPKPSTGKSNDRFRRARRQPPPTGKGESIRDSATHLRSAH
jgi:hypothetical protein